MKALINGTILCPNNGIIEKGIVVFDQGVIKAIGKDISTEGAEIIDADEKFVLPGFIDAQNQHKFKKLPHVDSFISQQVEKNPHVIPKL